MWLSDYCTVQLNYKLDPGMYEPQPGMYDDVMASDPPMIGTTFTQCERKPLVSYLPAN